ncbi:hypothetical protein GETHLI_34040 [Geothrix limicola]|uniref:TniQ domain-containing protein n=1 Tax=Geothrix limicola TaxID=2927978 RepID=A0ABQ5QJ30_9BACT|nr:hypothetical protein GETHLI_34040 [Geothrix limicola]
MSGACWPIRPPPLGGELLSSWMTRIAKANGVSLQCLCWETWPGSDLLMRDIDRHPPPGFIEELAKHSGHPAASIQRLVLRSLVGRLLVNLPPGSGWVQWILPILLRTRAAYGIQYCPECLAKDIEPHWRLNWRLAFVTTCPQHFRVLSDTCSSCGVAPNPLALFKGKRPATEPVPVHLCRWCGQDFRVICNDPSNSNSPSKGVVHFETTLLQALQENWMDVPGHGLVHSIPYFRGLHLIVTILASKGQSGRFRAAVCQELGIDQPPKLIPGRGGRVLFELQNVSTRHQLVAMAAWLMEDWPHRFTQACREASLSGTRLTLELQRDAPYWYWKSTGEQLGSKRAQWRRAALPDGLSLSYDDVSRRLQSRKLLSQERRIRFVRDHPELWGDPLRLTNALRSAGLYSPNSAPSLLVPYCTVLIALAKGEGLLHCFTKSLAVCCVRGRRQMVLLPSVSPSTETSGTSG